MNKVVNINLNGLVFILDEPAYDSLKVYLDELKKHFEGTLGAGEIIADIEARIAELLNERLSDRQQVVMQEDVVKIVEMMGNPNQMDEGGANTQDEPKTFTTNPAPKLLRRDKTQKKLGGVCAGIANYFGLDVMIPRILFLVAFFVFGSGFLLYLILWIAIPEANANDLNAEAQISTKRLFRSPDENMIGGVCAGLAKYFGIDPVWLRIGFLVSFFVFGSGFLVYIILWIAIPKARTSVDKLQMDGSVADVNNIEKTVRSQYESNNNGIRQASGFMSDLLGLAFRFLGKAAGALFVLLSVLLTGVIIFVWNYSFSNVLQRLDVSEFYGYFQWGVGLFCFAFAMLLLIIGIKLLFRARIRIRYLSLVLLFALATGVSLMIFFAVKYKQSIDHKETIKSTVINTQAPDTLYIKSIDDESKLSEKEEFVIGKKRLEFLGESEIYENIKLIIKPTEADSLQLVVFKTSRGANYNQAIEQAQNIAYSASYQSQVLLLGTGVFIPKNVPYKFQKVTTRLKVPIGTIIVVDRKIMKLIDPEFNEDFDIGETFKMTRSGLKCIDCAENIDDAETDIDVSIEDDEDGISITINENDEDENLADTLRTKETKVDIGPIKIRTEERK